MRPLTTSTETANNKTSSTRRSINKQVTSASSAVPTSSISVSHSSNRRGTIGAESNIDYGCTRRIQSHVRIVDALIQVTDGTGVRASGDFRDHARYVSVSVC